MKETIAFADIVWPYRPDLLIRIDFLQWLHEAEFACFLEDSPSLSKEDIFRNVTFFEEAKKHPYFLQFTKKRRYRRLNLNKHDSELVYAEGIASFVNLLKSIKEKGFDKGNKIGFRKTMFLRKPSYGEKIRRKYYMADGCHRLACFVWLNKKTLVPKEIIKVQHKLILRPVNAFGIFRKLRIVNGKDEVEFDQMFNSTRNISWDKMLEWAKRIRGRFRTLNVDELFKVRFSE